MEKKKRKKKSKCSVCKLIRLSERRREKKREKEREREEAKGEKRKEMRDACDSRNTHTHPGHFVDAALSGGTQASTHTSSPLILILLLLISPLSLVKSFQLTDRHTINALKTP